jgi:hypothetical protein
LRLKFVLLVAAALIVASPAFADIMVTFSSPVTFVSFYSSEPYTLSDNDGVAFVSVLSGYTLGAVSTVNDAGVTNIDFSGTPDYYVLDNLTYSVGGKNYTLTFDENTLQNCYCSIGGFYAGLPGGPVFSTNADVLTYPNYNYPGYPYKSSPDVIYEGPGEPPAVPEPSTLVMLGSGILAAGGIARRKFSLK